MHRPSLAFLAACLIAAGTLSACNQTGTAPPSSADVTGLTPLGAPGTHAP